MEVRIEFIAYKWSEQNKKRLFTNLLRFEIRYVINKHFGSAYCERFHKNAQRQ